MAETTHDADRVKTAIETTARALADGPSSPPAAPVGFYTVNGHNFIVNEPTPPVPKPPIIGAMPHAPLPDLNTATQMAPDQEQPLLGDPRDPMESFNYSMLSFNMGVDRYAIQSAAQYWSLWPTMMEIGKDAAVKLPTNSEPANWLQRAWDTLLQGIVNFFTNAKTPMRFINSILQAKWEGAMRELGRLVVNSTLGIGGFIDWAKKWFGWDKSDEDFGQTLAVWGWKDSVYLVLPFFPPMTVRDATGYVIDTFTDPLGFFIPLFGRLGMETVDRINSRSMQGRRDGWIDYENSPHKRIPPEAYQYLIDDFYKKRNAQIAE